MLVLYVVGLSIIVLAFGSQITGMVMVARASRELKSALSQGGEGDAKLKHVLGSILRGRDSLASLSATSRAPYEDFGRRIRVALLCFSVAPLLGLAVFVFV